MKLLMAHRILGLVFGYLGMAAAATMVSWPGPVSADFWFWCGACLVGEVLWIRLPLGQATGSMASCFHFAVVLLLPRGHAMAITALTGAFAETVFMRKPPLRVLFNAAQAALAVGGASLAYGALGGGAKDLPSLLYGFQLLPFVGAAIVYFVVNTGSVSWAVALSEGLSTWNAWKRNFGTRFELVSAGALISLGALLASHYALVGPGGTLLVVLPLLVALESYRRYSQRRAGLPAHTDEARDAA
ncbi:MAG TPA: hypothetical protein VEY91_12070 [Candidatus Limnocylindria bacterium]|nr:hypothetical protein [Candidatus Limnocylindria bacterium]